MARSPRTRKPTADNVTDNNVEDNISTPESDGSEMSEQTLPADNVEPTTDNVESTESVEAPDNSADNSDDNVTPPASVEEKFELPEDPTQLKLSDPFAEVIGMRLMDILSKVKDNRDLLKAQEEGDTSAAIVSYAESDTASETITEIYGHYSAMKAELDQLFAQLTAAVKTEKGDVQLTPAEVEEKKNLHKTLVTSAKHALVAYSDYARDNDCGPDVILFGKTIEGMIGGRSATAPRVSGGASNYVQSTNVRPRLGDEGYVKVNNMNYGNFSEAVKAIKKIDGGKDINVGQIHAGWVKAATGSDDLAKWSDISNGIETTFTVGSEDNPITVTVVKNYTK